MSEYLVTWSIDIEAASPEEAARQALAIQRRSDSIATVFKVDERVGAAVVKPHTVDLSNACPGCGYLDCVCDDDTVEGGV